MRENPVQVIIIIPVYGRLDVFETMARIRSYRWPYRLSFCVIDNGNGPALAGELAALASADCTVVRLESNQGGAGAFRKGMGLAADEDSDADFAWLLDDDALVNPETLPALMREYERIRAEEPNVAVGAVGSTMLGRRNPTRITEVGCGVSALTGRIGQRFKGCDIGDVGLRTDCVDYVAAASMLVPVNVIREIGVFWDIFIHWDDIEWCLRAGSVGYRIYATTHSTVNHLEASRKVADWIRYYDIRNQLSCLRSHAHPGRFGAAFLGLLQRIFTRLQGRPKLAALMALGAKHARTGELLYRNCLPTVETEEFPPEEVLKMSRYCVVFTNDPDARASWMPLLEGLPAFFVGRRPGCGKLWAYIGLFFRQMRLQWKLWLIPGGTILFDASCVVGHPFPLFGRQKFFFRDDGHGMILFRESK